MPSAISIHNVTKTFGPRLAVDRLNLEVPEGSLCGFIGPNGAGKSTTIRMIMSIIFPDSGDLSVLGKSSAVESKDRIGYLPEERGVYRKMRVGPFLNYIGRLKGMDSKAVDKKVREWLGRMELGDCYRKKCEELSKGMQQKVQFIAAVIHDPDLLILDEPFSGLDPVNRRLLRELITEQHEAGRTIVFSTHAMYEAEQLCDHLFMINRGVKVLDLPMHAVWSQYDPKAVAFELFDPPDTATRTAWGAWPGIREVLVDENAVEFKMKDGADPGPVMNSVMQSQRIRKMEIKRPSLEDVFIELVGGSVEELRAEKPESPPRPFVDTSPFA